MPDTTSLLSQIYVKLDGSEAPPELMSDLGDVTVESSLHLSDVANLTLRDPRLLWIDDRRLNPGTALVISARVGQAEHVLFDGEIVELEPHFDPATQRLTVRAFDRLHRLTRGQRVRSFQQVTAGDLIEKLAREAGLRADIAPMAQVHDYLIQHNETNLEFLRALAARYGYLLFVRGQTLYCKPPEASGEPIELEWGTTLSEFHPHLTTLGQSGEIVVRGWDPDSRQAIVGQATSGHAAPRIGQAGSGGELARDAFGVDAQRLVTDVVVRSQREADRLAQAAADRLSGAFIEADGVCAGNPALTAGSAIRLVAVGNRFGGTYVVTSATHRYSAQGYATEFSVSGHHPATLLARIAPQAARPAPAPLVVGVVTDNLDPAGLGRVKVKYPSLSDDHASYWARVVVPGGGAERGIQFLPEINDEVLLGFEQGDPLYPYVLGGLWNGRDAPPLASGEAVSGGVVRKRVIRTRAGHQIVFDDDASGGITIEDHKGNNLRISSADNSLAVDVRGDLRLTCDGNLTLRARGKVDISGMGASLDGGPASVDVTGAVIKLN